MSKSPESDQPTGLEPHMLADIVEMFFGQHELSISREAAEGIAKEMMDAYGGKIPINKVEEHHDWLALKLQKVTNAAPKKSDLGELVLQFVIHTESDDDIVDLDALQAFLEVEYPRATGEQIEMALQVVQDHCASTMTVADMRRAGVMLKAKSVLNSVNSTLLEKAADLIFTETHLGRNRIQQIIMGVTGWGDIAASTHRQAIEKIDSVKITIDDIVDQISKHMALQATWRRRGVLDIEPPEED